MENATPTTFEERMLVKFDDSRSPAFIKYVKKFHREGPFEITEVKTIPTECNCGERSPNPYCHYRGCQIHHRRLAGHHQWVTIKAPHEESVFSGALLKIAERKEA